MSSRSSASLTEASARTRRTMGRRSGSPSMSEKQTQAYLAARDALRRIRRTSALLAELPNAGLQPVGRSETPRRADAGSA